MDRVINVGILAVKETAYVRMIVQGLADRGLIPNFVMLGTRTARVMAALATVRSVRRRHGLREVFYRRNDRRQEAQNVNADKLPNIKALRDLCQEYRIEMIPFDYINDGQTILSMQKKRPDILVLAGSGIVGRAVIDIPNLGCVNGHPAILPGARGVDVIEWGLVNDHPMGVTAHLVDSKVDAGDIILQHNILPEKGETFADYKSRMVLEQANTVCHATYQIATQEHNLLPNDISKSTLYFVNNRQVRRNAEERFARLVK